MKRIAVLVLLVIVAGLTVAHFWQGSTTEAQVSSIPFRVGQSYYIHIIPGGGSFEVKVLDIRGDWIQVKVDTFGTTVPKYHLDIADKYWLNTRHIFAMSLPADSSSDQERKAPAKKR